MRLSAVIVFTTSVLVTVACGNSANSPQAAAPTSSYGAYPPGYPPPVQGATQAPQVYPSNAPAGYATPTHVRARAAGNLCARPLRAGTHVRARSTGTDARARAGGNAHGGTSIVGRDGHSRAARTPVSERCDMRLASL
jgi:hypothetical protein